MREKAETTFHGIDLDASLTELAARDLNYRRNEAAGPAWSTDHHRFHLPSEAAGEPEPDGAWHVGCRIVEDYGFSPPDVVRAVYRSGRPLLGRDMLLEGRFFGLRLYVGVRITGVIDHTHADGRRVWGWSYETLQGHLECGSLSYEMVKHQHTGDVEFVIRAYSRLASTVGPVLRTGWWMFGRRRQSLFYRRCGNRMRRLAAQRGYRRPAADAQGLVLAPSDARPGRVDRVAQRVTNPGD